MSEQTMHIKLEGEPGVHTILIGQANTPILPTALKISGDINTVSKFMAVRVGNPLTDHIVVDRGSCILRYSRNDKDVKGDAIYGALTLNDTIATFGINTDKSRTAKDLALFFKMNRYYFVDKNDCSKMVTELNGMKAKVEHEIESSKDDRGNKRELAEKKVISNIPTEFKLELSIYNGQSPSTFRVEIVIDHSDGGIKCWLLSPELEELKLTLRDQLIDEEIARIKLLGNYVIIEQ